MTDAATLRALIERVEGATEADAGLDTEIALRLGLPLADWTWDASPYTSSLDAAASLYPVRPAMIPACPRKATADALRARLADMEAGSCTPTS